MDLAFLMVGEEPVEGPNVTAEKRLLLHIVDQMVDSPGPMPIDELTKAPTVGTESSVQQRMVKQIVNLPGPMAMDERPEVPKVSAETSGQCAWSSSS